MEMYQNRASRVNVAGPSRAGKTLTLKGYPFIMEKIREDRESGGMTGI
ncbi:MAG: hypothetical protein KA801_00535 [Syntrophorhabdaceae bacterium]|nr:hypothetical protein [Syntrophorhabdaceae bacterium]